MNTVQKKYRFELSHDDGTKKIAAYARSEELARSQIIHFENCPDGALTLIDSPLLEIGCHFDSHRGIYQGQAVIELAIKYGFGDYEEEDKNPDGEFYCETWESAEQFLDDFVPEGHYFGQNENSGDSGVWKINACDYCDTTGINGTLCHETGCPNKEGQLD